MVFFFRNPAIKKLAGKKECNNVGPVHQDAAAPVQGEASSNPLAEVMGLGLREAGPPPIYKWLRTAEQHEKQD